MRKGPHFLQCLVLGVAKQKRPSRSHARLCQTSCQLVGLASARIQPSKLCCLKRTCFLKSCMPATLDRTEGNCPVSLLFSKDVFFCLLCCLKGTPGRRARRLGEPSSLCGELLVFFCHSLTFPPLFGPAVCQAHLRRYQELWPQHSQTLRANHSLICKNRCAPPSR